MRLEVKNYEVIIVHYISTDRLKRRLGTFMHSEAAGVIGYDVNPRGGAQVNALRLLRQSR
jgi:hypothetical protein